VFPWEIIKTGNKIVMHLTMSSPWGAEGGKEAGHLIDRFGAGHLNYLAVLGVGNLICKYFTNI